MLRTKVLQAVLNRPAEGLNYQQIAEAIGENCHPVRDALWRLRSAGQIAWLQRSRFMLHFGSEEARDAFAEQNQFKRVKSYADRLKEQKESRQQVATETMQAMRSTGATAQDVGKALGSGRYIARNLLAAMEREGLAWRCGPKNMVAWFATEADMKAAAHVVMSRMAAKHADHINKRRAAGWITSQKKPREKPKKVRSDFKVVAEKSAQKPAQERKPVEIIGMDKAKFTPAVHMPDHRYVVGKEHRGEFSSLGIGRYAE